MSDELTQLAIIVRAMEELPEEARKRTLNYLLDRYIVHPPTKAIEVASVEPACGFGLKEANT